MSSPPVTKGDVEVNKVEADVAKDDMEVDVVKSGAEAEAEVKSSDSVPTSEEYEILREHSHSPSPDTPVSGLVCIFKRKVPFSFHILDIFRFGFG